MAIQVSELRSDEAGEVAAMWRAHGDATPPEQAEKALFDHLQRFSGLSLVARDNRQIVGVVIVGRDAAGACRNHLCLAPGHAQDGLDRLLIDKAMVKLHSKGIRKFRLQGLGEQSVHEVWESVRWLRNTVTKPSADTRAERDEQPAEPASDSAEAAPEPAAASPVA